MYDEFISFVEEQELIQKEEKILLAVSGGIDSMCLAHLFQKSPYNFGIAHLNHGMRGEASDRDEELCRLWAQENGLPFLSKTVDLTDITSNFQAEARKIRYKWLNEILGDFQYDLIATAHHLDDQVENLFLKLSRGASLSGLRGIKVKSVNVIRPLLFADKQMIAEYVKNENIQFREDSSNRETKYLRNFFRNKVLPPIEERLPNFRDQILSSQRKLGEAEDLLFQFVKKLKQESTSSALGIEIINLGQFTSFGNAPYLLFLMLKPYGLNRSQAEDLWNSDTGAIIQSEHLVFLKNRHEVHIRKRQKHTFYSLQLREIPSSLDLDDGQKLEFLEISPPLMGNTGSGKILVSSNKLILPLTIRSRQDGDFFFPSGMNMKKKKLKKFLIDEKLSQFQKEKVKLLVNGDGKIIWIIGMRGDERFTSNNEDEKIIQMSLSQS